MEEDVQLAFDCFFCGREVTDTDHVDLSASWAGGSVTFPAHAQCLRGAADSSVRFFDEHPDHAAVDERVDPRTPEQRDAWDELTRVLSALDDGTELADPATALAVARDLAEVARTHGIPLEDD